jgi:hypothetical protein
MDEHFERLARRLPAEMLDVKASIQGRLQGVDASARKAATAAGA